MAGLFSSLKNKNIKTDLTPGSDLFGRDERAIREKRRAEALKVERLARAEEFAGMSPAERFASLSEFDPTVSDKPGFKRRVLRETAPFREAARQATGSLLELATQPLAESEDFQRDLREALVQQRFNLAAFGAGDSTFGAEVLGRTGADIASAERRRRGSLLQFLAGGAETGFGTTGAQIGRQKQEAFAREQLRSGEKIAKRQILADVVGTAAGFALA
jgi:hypothetical protein